MCGWDGEIEVVEEDGKLIWKCPQCGNTDQDKMNVARRTCGYIGTQFWNQGRTQEIRTAVLQTCKPPFFPLLFFNFILPKRDHVITTEP